MNSATNSGAVFGKAVRVAVMDTDRYGRLVCDVYFPGKQGEETNLNQSLVKAGMAWWYRQYAPRDARLQALEAEARAAKRGLWVDPLPVPPWDFRHGKNGGGVSLAVPKAGSIAALTTAPKASAGAAATVYVTATGKKYHLAGCRYLRGGGTAETVSQATAAGLSPCKVCGP